jgi:Flp pilus assembly protein TadB
MAQTKKKRRKKRRGTQSGRVDARRGPRPRNRQEAQARARSRSKGGKSGQGRQGRSRGDQEPTWRGAFVRGAVAAGLFVVIVVLLFKRPMAPALGLGVLMLAFYVPMGYFIDRFFYNRRQRQRQAERQARKEDT